MICGAKTRIGSPCKKNALKGHRRCRNHGGLSPSGEAHWNYQHGRCSKEVRDKNRLVRDQIKHLQKLGESLGMFTVDS